MSKKIIKPTSMEALLAGLPNTGITKGSSSNEAAEYVAAHPENWTQIFQGKRGRPRRGQENGSRTKSIRFPEEAWDAIEKKAAECGLTLHAALRKVILQWACQPEGSLAVTLEPQSQPVLSVPVLLYDAQPTYGRTPARTVTLTPPPPPRLLPTGVGTRSNAASDAQLLEPGKPKITKARIK